MICSGPDKRGCREQIREGSRSRVCGGQNRNRGARAHHFPPQLSASTPSILSTEPRTAR